MESDGRGWLQGCAIGCGVLIVVAVLFGVGGVMMVMRPLGNAVNDRTELDQQFGDQCDYTPPVDGVVPPDRIEAFVRVRSQLAVHCRVIEANSLAMRRLEELDGQETPSRREVLVLSGKATMGAMRLGPALGRLFEFRNRALLDEAMGLGEYTYIYLTAYQRQLAEIGPGTGVMDGSPVNRRIGACVEQMLSGQLDAALAQGADPGWVTGLETELASMKSGSRRAPWRDGLPDAVAASYAPYRSELDEGFCAFATELELLRGKRHRFGIESE